MSIQTTLSSKKFADTLRKFIANDNKHTSGCEKRLFNMLITKENNVITVKNNLMKTVLVITEEKDGQSSYLMRFSNAITLNRLMAAIEMLGWEGFEFESKGGITRLKTTNGKPITLNSSLLYSKAELDEIKGDSND